MTTFEQLRAKEIYLKLGDALTKIVGPAILHFLVSKGFISNTSILDVYEYIKLLKYMRRWQYPHLMQDCSRYALSTKNIAIIERNSVEHGDLHAINNEWEIYLKAWAILLKSANELAAASGISKLRDAMLANTNYQYKRDPTVAIKAAIAAKSIKLQLPQPNFRCFFQRRKN